MHRTCSVVKIYDSTIIGVSVAAVSVNQLCVSHTAKHVPIFDLRTLSHSGQVKSNFRFTVSSFGLKEKTTQQCEEPWFPLEQDLHSLHLGWLSACIYVQEGSGLKFQSCKYTVFFGKYHLKSGFKLQDCKAKLLGNCDS